MSEHVLLSPAKFQILKNIAFLEKSPTELATDLGFSVPYVHSQLVLLEAQGFVKKKVHRKGKAGKPKSLYKLNGEFANVEILREGFGSQFKISRETHALIYLQLLNLMPLSTHFLASKYYWANVEEIDKIHALSLISIDDDKIELFGIVDSDDVDELRKKISHVKLFDEKGNEKTIVCWINTLKECEEGISKKDSYYLSHITRAKALIDGEKILDKLKEAI